MPSARLRRHRAAALAGAVGLVLVGATAASDAALSSAAMVSEPAVRIPVERPPVEGPIRSVAFVGDSLIADYREIVPTPPGYTNDVVPLVRSQLDRRLGAGAVDVHNHAVAGLAVKYQLPSFTPNNLRAELNLRYGTTGAVRPDLVVITVGNIDLANVPTPIERLAPELASELRHAVDELAALGIETVIVPALPVRASLFGFFRPAVDGLPDRIRYLNEQLSRWSLPLLADTIERFDHDRDGVPELAYYLDYHPTLPDDGVHLNRAGQYVLAGAIGPVLADVIQIANSGRRS